MRLSFVLAAGLILTSLTSIACAQNGCWTEPGLSASGTITFCPVGPTPKGNGGRTPQDYDRERAAERERKKAEWEAENARYEATWSQAKSASARGDYAEALRLFLAAQSMRHGKHSKTAIAITRGNLALSTGDKRAALKYFKEAASICLQCFGDGPNAAQNSIQRLENAVRAEERTARENAATQRRNTLAASAMKAKLGQMVDSLSSTTMRDAVNDKTASKGLTFQGAETPSQNGTSNSEQGPGSTNFFGVKSNPSQTDLHRDDTNIPGAGTAATDQLKSMAGSSISGQQQTNNEASAVEAGRTPDQGLGRPEQAPVTTVSTPASQRVLPPAVAQAVAADKDYQALEAQRTRALQEKDQAEKELSALEEKQKTELDSTKRQANQIAISNLTQRKQAAEGRAAAAELEEGNIIKRYQGAPIIIPAADQNTAPPKNSEPPPPGQSTSSPKNPDPPRTP